MSDAPFVPAWAESMLGEKHPAHDQAELAMLREFFERWEAFHAIENDKLHRRAKEAAIRALVESAAEVRRFRDVPLRIGHA